MAGPVSADADEYRHVQARRARYDYDNETLVQASHRTRQRLLGADAAADAMTAARCWSTAASCWATERARNAPARRRRRRYTVTGLLRITEPGGGFLRHNDPAAERWYSRDVQAIAAARGLADVAPYFIDAERAAAGARDGPPGPGPGLTVLAFPNSHLVYAITWYALALMVAGAPPTLSATNAACASPARRASDERELRPCRASDRSADRLRFLPRRRAPAPRPQLLRRPPPRGRRRHDTTGHKNMQQLIHAALVRGGGADRHHRWWCTRIPHTAAAELHGARAGRTHRSSTSSACCAGGWRRKSAIPSCWSRCWWTWRP